MIAREGICLICRTVITLNVPLDADDENRFYWRQSIDCPICWNREVLMMKVTKE